MILKCFLWIFETKHFSTSNSTYDVDVKSDFYYANYYFENCVINNGLEGFVVVFSQMVHQVLGKRIYFFNRVDDVDGSVAYPRPVVVENILKNKITCSMCSFEQDKHDKTVSGFQGFPL